MATKPTKKSDLPSHGHHKVNTVTNHRLAGDMHSHVFPEHVGTPHWHKGSRNGHGGSHSVTSKGRK